MIRPIRNLFLALAAPLLLAATASHAADIQPRTIKFSYVQPKESHMGYGVEKFAELVAKKSGNKIKVRGYPNGTLGGDLQTVSALQGGTIEMTTMPPGLLVGLSKEYGAFDLPFLFNSFQEADAVLDGPVGKRFLDQAPKGLVGLAYWDHGFRNISNSKRPIAKAEDLGGLKLRALQAPLMIETFNALGSNAVPLAFTELFTAMETRAVDGQDNPIVAFETNKFDEVQKHLSTTRHVYNPLMVMISRKAWDSYSAAEREILLAAAREASIEQRRVSREMEQSAIAKVRQKGVTITEVSDAERARMREKVKPVTDKFTREIGEDVVKAFHVEISKVRGGK
ncbi:TRAP transporter substrate-binding protein [Ramlibacter rhizophilus]|uniref:TRAP transporter substrate-binding protein n=1 Tax=Ramlibacter rhizophilus TaxID=1781167 RepID=A0A4Z0BLA3_9BURK|nr:TRAP transporter substrate-binding protein [Ramlibacter rhizophilus]TFY98698.1 TRAP transporter substrate-binding protein [Ramlibacter rhizophilus]